MLSFLQPSINYLAQLDLLRRTFRDAASLTGTPPSTSWPAAAHWQLAFLSVFQRSGSSQQPPPLPTSDSDLDSDIAAMLENPDYDAQVTQMSLTLPRPQSSCSFTF